MGDAVRQSGIPRSEVFLTTKILSTAGSPEKTYQKCLDSVKLIDEGENGYVDLFLIHSPSAGPAKRKEMWGALERLYEEGRAKAIGVSNFGVGHVEGMKEWAKVWPPHVNQLEVCCTCRIHSSLFYPCSLRSISLPLNSDSPKSSCPFMLLPIIQKNPTKFSRSFTPGRSNVQ